MQAKQPVVAVRCRACGKVYAKPAKGGIAVTNPGCPACGYLGWMPASTRLSSARGRLRSGVDPRLRPLG